MNNKHIGNAFEREFCLYLASQGWWVHFIIPARDGSQPFDVIAVKCGIAKVFDCKTSSGKRFPYGRLEENQKMAFEKWIACGNSEPYIAVKYNENIYLIEYSRLKREGVIDLAEENSI